MTDICVCLCGGEGRGGGGVCNLQSSSGWIVVFSYDVWKLVYVCRYGLQPLSQEDHDFEKAQVIENNLTVCDEVIQPSGTGKEWRVCCRGVQDERWGSGCM